MPAASRTASKIFGVARAAAEVPGKRLADLVVARVGLVREQIGRRHDSPGVQNPHWTAPVSTNASCTRCSRPSSARPSTVTTSWPSACAASTRHAQTSVPSSRTEHEPHSPCSQAFFEPGRPEPLAERVEQALARPDLGLVLLAVDGQRDLHASTVRARVAVGRGARGAGTRPYPRTSSIGLAASATCSAKDSPSSSGAARAPAPARPSRRPPAARRARGRPTAPASRPRSPSRSAARPS